MALKIPEIKTENIWGFLCLLFLKATLSLHKVIVKSFLLKQINK